MTKFIQWKDQIESIWATRTYVVLKTTLKKKTNRGAARQHRNTSSLLNNTDPLNMQQAGWLANVIQAPGLWCHCEGDTVEVEF